MNNPIRKLQFRFSVKQNTLEKAVKIYLTVGQSTFSSTLAAEITGGIHGSALRSLKNEHVIELVQKRGEFQVKNKHGNWASSPGFWKFTQEWINYMRTMDGQEVCDAAGIC